MDSVSPTCSTADMNTSLRADLRFGTLPGLVVAAATRDPDGLAIDGDEPLTFSQLAEQVNEIAAGLVGIGIQRGDRVAIQAPNCTRWIVAALAAHSAGAGLVPINTRYKGEETADVVVRSGARLLFTVRGFLGVDYWDQLRATGVALPTGVDLGDEGGDGLLPFGALRGTRMLLPDVDPGSPSDILYTSGTTGLPKGVVCSHAQTLRVFGDWAAIAGLGPSDRYLVVPPFFHCFGYKAGWLACLLTGATCLPQAVFDVPAVVDRLVRDRITTLPGPPALYQSLLDRADAVRAAPLRLAITGAAVVPVELIRRMHDELGFTTVLTAYGLTESCGVATMCRRGDAAEVVSATSGRAIPDVEVRVVNESGGPLPAGEVGEIQVRGYNIMAGYWGDAEATAATMVCSGQPGSGSVAGWLKTGDVGWLDEQGYLRITDRLKDMFVVGGFKAFPAEIEAVLRRFPGVTDVAVVGMAHPRLGEVGRAFVVAAQEFDLDALDGWAKERLANFKVPRRYERVEALPRNASGKVLKRVLRQWGNAG